MIEDSYHLIVTFSTFIIACRYNSIILRHTFSNARICKLDYSLSNNAKGICIVSPSLKIFVRMLSLI